VWSWRKRWLLCLPLRVRHLINSRKCMIAKHWINPFTQLLSHRQPSSATVHPPLDLSPSLSLSLRRGWLAQPPLGHLGWLQQATPLPSSAFIFKKHLIKPEIIRCGCVFFLRVFQLMWQPLNDGRKTKILYTNQIEVIIIFFKENPLNFQPIVQTPPELSKLSFKSFEL
jgi:hypothetical protein